MATRCAAPGESEQLSVTAVLVRDDEQMTLDNPT
jgi:hypothetical protein